MKLFKDRAAKKAEKQEKYRIHEEKVKKRKSTLRTLAEAEDLYLPEEETIDFINGVYISVILGSEVQNSGMLIVTDQRVLLYGRRPIGYDLKSIDYSNINSINFTRSHPIGQLDINTFGETINFATVMNETGMKIVEIIHARRKSITDSINLNNVEKASTVEELKDYKELLDMKIINQEEFNVKKAELLAL